MAIYAQNCAAAQDYYESLETERYLATATAFIPGVCAAIAGGWNGWISYQEGDYTGAVLNVATGAAFSAMEGGAWFGGAESTAEREMAYGGAEAFSYETQEGAFAGSSAMRMAEEGAPARH